MTSIATFLDQTVRENGKITTPMTGEARTLCGFSPRGHSVCKNRPHPFWTIIAFRVMWWSLCLPLLRSSGTFSSPLSFRPAKNTHRGHAGILLQCHRMREKITFCNILLLQQPPNRGLLRLPRIRRLRIGRPRKLAAMFPGTYTTPETSRVIARKQTTDGCLQVVTEEPPQT